MTRGQGGLLGWSAGWLVDYEIEIGIDRRTDSTAKVLGAKEFHMEEEDVGTQQAGR